MIDTHPHPETIVISDGESSSSLVSNGGSETERELPESRPAKRQRGMSSASYQLHQFKPSLVHGPDHAGENTRVDLSASVSSLCLEEAPPLAGPSTRTSTVILGSWSAMRKASARFVVGGDVPEASLEF